MASGSSKHQGFKIMDALVPLLIDFCLIVTFVSISTVKISKRKRKILLCNMSNTRDSVSSKHLKESWKYDMLRTIYTVAMDTVHP